jgi:hypothetical protein
MLLPLRPAARPPQRSRAGTIGRVVPAEFLHEVYTIFGVDEVDRLSIPVLVILQHKIQTPQDGTDARPVAPPYRASL